MKFNDIAFVGTYECNTDCSYCYADKYIKPYKGIELSFDRYKELLLRLHKNGVTRIIFIGGEPGLWKHINSAVKFAKDMGIKVNIMSNAMIRIQEIPDLFSIHINVLLFTKDKNILKNIYYYAKKTKVELAYNVWEINKYNLGLIQNLLSKLNLPIGLNIVFNDNISKEIGEYFYKLARFLKENTNVKIEIVGPVPICIFTDAQYIYLKYNLNLTSTCGVPSFKKTDAFTIINPDGKTILPCAPLPFTADISYLLNNDVGKYIKKFAPHTKKLRSIVPDMCKGCEYHGNKCQYGCLVNKFDSEDLKKGRILI